MHACFCSAPFFIFWVQHPSKRAVPPTVPESSHLSQCNQDSFPRGPSPKGFWVLWSSVDTWGDLWTSLGDGLQPRTEFKSDYHWTLLKYTLCLIMMPRDVFTASRDLQKCPCEPRSSLTVPPPPPEHVASMFAMEPTWHVYHPQISSAKISAFCNWCGLRKSVQDENFTAQWRLSFNDSLWNHLFPVPTVIWTNCLIILCKCHYFCKHQFIRSALLGWKKSLCFFGYSVSSSHWHHCLSDILMAQIESLQKRVLNRSRCLCVLQSETVPVIEKI